MNIKIYPIIISLFLSVGCTHQSLQMDPRAIEGIKAHTRGDYTNALALFSAGAADNDPVSLYMLGLCNELGTGTARDTIHAFNLYNQSAECGYPYAWRALGVCYRDGVGTERNPQSALAYFNKAMSGGVSIALTDLGAMYMVGDGVQKDEQKAADLYLEGARKGDPLSKQNLGEMYYNGRHFTVNQAKACRLFSDAAKDGFIQSVVWTVALSDAGNTNITPVSAEHIWRKQIESAQLQKSANDLTTALKTGSTKDIESAGFALSRQCYYYGLQK